MNDEKICPKCGKEASDIRYPISGGTIVFTCPQGHKWVVSFTRIREEELAGLRAIELETANWPRTKDGKLITVGMTLYWKSLNAATLTEGKKVSALTICEEGYSAFWCDEYGSEYAIPVDFDLYNSQEKAQEAAKKAKAIEAMEEENRNRVNRITELINYFCSELAEDAVNGTVFDSDVIKALHEVRRGYSKKIKGQL